jgi:uncharacterized protein
VTTVRGRCAALINTLLIVLLAGSANAVLACPLRLPITAVEINGARLELEIAATVEARVCGLSRRTALGPERGMLFVTPAPEMMSFWMKDTTLPLAIAFVYEDGRILSIQQMTPLQTEERYLPPEPVRFAVEVNQGWFERHGVEVGDVLELRLPRVLRIE